MSASTASKRARRTDEANSPSLASPAPKRRSSRAGVSPPGSYNEFTMNQKSSGGGKYGHSNGARAACPDYTTTQAPTRDTTDPNGRGGYRKRKNVVHYKKGQGLRRTRAQNEQRKAKPARDTAEEAKMLKIQMMKLNKSYSTSKQRNKPHSWLANLVLVFLRICYVAHVIKPRFLTLEDAYKEAANEYGFDTSEYKVRTTHQNWVNSGQMYFAPSMAGKHNEPACSTMYPQVVSPVPEK